MNKSLNIVCAPKDFNEVFEIPVEILTTQKYTAYVDVDLIEPGSDISKVALPTVLRQQIYKDSELWIVVSVASR